MEKDNIRHAIVRVRALQTAMREFCDAFDAVWKNSGWFNRYVLTYWWRVSLVRLGAWAMDKQIRYGEQLYLDQYGTTVMQDMMADADEDDGDGSEG